MKKILFLLPILLLGACSHQPTTNPNKMTYKTSQGAMNIERGVVISVEEGIVQIDGRNDVAAGGAIVGGIAGSQVSSGSGRDVAIAVGTVAGAAAGKLISSKKEKAFIYTVETRNDQLIQVVQSGEFIPKGSKVLINFYKDRKTISLDGSQGPVFDRTEDTKYSTPAPEEEVDYIDEFEW